MNLGGHSVVTVSWECNITLAIHVYDHQKSTGITLHINSSAENDHYITLKIHGSFTVLRIQDILSAEPSIVLQLMTYGGFIIICFCTIGLYPMHYTLRVMGSL